ncbi:hypothetical protein [Paenibacillus xylanexedens]|uniref:hypothetical protein n=1 Tax=Paenibacillus xylanexedens TaxID=528191 RepID=UPI00119EDB92|nr:hypothetical protein [Paenibacillus xylanexedens]
MEALNLQLDEACISSLHISQGQLEIVIQRWDLTRMSIMIAHYTRLYEYNSLGREINTVNVLRESELLETEKRELKEMDHDPEEYVNLVHFQFIGFSDLPLLDIIVDPAGVKVDQIMQTRI